jgi:hypothetical protein
VPPAAKLRVWRPAFCINHCVVSVSSREDMSCLVVGELMTELRKKLIESLRAAWTVDPDLRFGQMLSVLASPTRVIHVADEVLLARADRFRQLREPRLGEELIRRETREEILQQVAAYSEVHPTWNLGRLTINLAGRGGAVNSWLIYDIEDEILLRGAKSPSDCAIRPDPVEWPDYAIPE